MLRSLEKKEKKGMTGKAAAAIVTATILTTSMGVYAAVNLFTVQVTEENGDQVRIQVENSMEGKAYPIEITAGYLPAGYEESEDGKYSLGGERGRNGLTITDEGWCPNWGQAMEYIVSDVSNAETLQFQDAQGVLITHEGYEYPYNMNLYYEESGHIVSVYAAQEVSREELMKVCENLEITEKEGSAEETPVFKIPESEEAERIYIGADHIKNVGDIFPSAFNDGVNLKVTDITIKDTVNTELLNENTTADYGQLQEYLDGNVFKPYDRYVEEWNDQKMEQIPLNTVPVKNVEVTMEVTNTTSEAMADVNLQPSAKRYAQQEDGTYTEDGSIPGYEMQDSFRGSGIYLPAIDGFPYYFDSSAFSQSTHFYNMELQPEETKTVHLWFAVPEDEIGNSYLSFNLNAEQEYLALIKIE